MPKAYIKLRLDKEWQAGEYPVKIAKGSPRIDPEGNLHLVYIIDEPSRGKQVLPREPISLATTPAKTLKVKASGFRRRGY